VKSCPLHPEGSPIKPQWSTDQCIHCFRLAGGVVPVSSKAIIPMRGERTLPCRHDLGVIEYAPCGKESMHRRECEIHDECTRGVSRIKSCQMCDEYDSFPTYNLYTSAGGIGDAVSALYVACGLADTGVSVRYRTRHLPWLIGVNHPDLEILPHSSVGVNVAHDASGELKSSALGTCPSRPDWYCRNVSRMANVRPFTASRPKKVQKPDPVIGSGYVVFSPFSHHHSREWPIARWQELAKSLSMAGRKVVVIDRAGRGNVLERAFGQTAGVSWHFGMSPAWTVACIANASQFVGNDSGMAHVAGLHGTPSVVVSTILKADFVFGKVVESIRGVEADGWDCQGCGWQRPCPTGNRCGALDSIPAEKVLKRVLQLA